MLKAKTNKRTMRQLKRMLTTGAIMASVAVGAFAQHEGHGHDMGDRPVYGAQGERPDPPATPDRMGNGTVGALAGAAVGGFRGAIAGRVVGSMNAPSHGGPDHGGGRAASGREGGGSSADRAGSGVDHGPKR
jgi:hypothetical protein